MKTIILTEKHFDSSGVFTAEEFYNTDTWRYEFRGNVKINVLVSIFKKSVFVEGDQTVTGYQTVEGYQYVKGNQTVTGYQYVEGDQTVNGYQTVTGYQTVEGDQYVKGNQTVEGYQTVNGDQTVTGNQTVTGYQTVEGDQTVEGYQTVTGYQTVKFCKLLKPRGSITINHIGSRNAATTFYFTVESGVMVQCGCKFLPIDEFEQRVKSTHGDNQFAREYQYAIEYAKNMDAYYRGLR